MESNFEMSVPSGGPNLSVGQASAFEAGPSFEGPPAAGPEFPTEGEVVFEAESLSQEVEPAEIDEGRGVMDLPGTAHQKLETLAQIEDEEEPKRGQERISSSQDNTNQRGEERKDRKEESGKREDEDPELKELLRRIKELLEKLVEDQKASLPEFP